MPVMEPLFYVRPKDNKTNKFRNKQNNKYDTLHNNSPLLLMYVIAVFLKDMSDSGNLGASVLIIARILAHLCTKGKHKSYGVEL